MSGKKFKIQLSSGLVAPARDLHKASQIGSNGMGPHRSFEVYLSELVTVAIVERIQAKSEKGPNQDRKLCA